MTFELMGDAAMYALMSHEKQVRKYTGEPYIAHPAEVAGYVWLYNGSPHAVAAAWLHDVVEDCGVPLETILKRFGQEVHDLVHQLTDITTPQDGNRAKRKEIERARWPNASKEAKLIKLADLISNTRSIVKNDPGFAKVYMQEKKLLLPHLRSGNEALWGIANNLVCDWEVEALLKAS